MPIIHVNMAAGRTRAMKDDLARKVTQAVVDALHADASTIRVLIHEVQLEDWFSGGESLADRSAKTP